MKGVPDNVRQQIQMLAHLAGELRRQIISYTPEGHTFDNLQYWTPARGKFMAEHLNHYLVEYPQVENMHSELETIAESFRHPMVCFGRGSEEDDYSDPLRLFTEIYGVSADRFTSVMWDRICTGEKPEFPITELEYYEGVAEAKRKAEEAGQKVRP